MKFNKLGIVLRSRAPFEAMDLGFLMAQRWYMNLLTLWLVITFPILLFFSLLLPDYMTIVVFAFWWLLPFWERPLCWFMSQAVFDSQPSLLTTIKHLPHLFHPQCLPWLTWRRLSPSRSFCHPVVLLEHMKGQAFRQRKQALLGNSNNSPAFLSFICAHMAAALYYAFFAIIFFFTPANLPMDWEHIDWSEASVIGQLNQVVEQLQHADLASVASVYIALSIITPFYVSAGFALYLNQRTKREGWDIDLQFKRIRHSAKSKPLTAILFIGFFAASFQPSTSYAKEHLLGPDTTQVKQQINDVLADLEHEEKSVTRWRFTFSPDSDMKSSTSQNNTIGNTISTIIKVLIWLVGIGLALFLAYQARQYWLQYGTEQNLTTTRLDTSSTMQMRLPEKDDTSLDTVQMAYKEGAYRSATTLLWCLTLQAINQSGRVELSPSMTEGECVATCTASFKQGKLLHFLQRLATLKVKLCYANQLPNAAQLGLLIDEYQSIVSEANEQ